MSATKTPRVTKALWTKYADQRLIDGMLAQCEKGKKLDNGFKKEVWQEIMEEFNKGAIEEEKTVQQLKTRMNTMKQKWKSFTHLLNSSGFGWSSEAEVVTASESVWRDYLKNFPKAAEFKHHSLENYTALDKIFRNTTATGSKAVTSSGDPSGSRESHPIDLDSVVEDAPFAHREDASTSIEDGLTGSQADPDWYEGDISYFIAQQEELENAIDPVLSRTNEIEYSPQSSSINFRDSITTTTTPVRSREINNRGKRRRQRAAGLGEPSIASIAERLSNEVSDFIAETRANKRARLIEETQVPHRDITSPAKNETASVPDQFQPYRDALAILMEMYKDGKFGVDEVTEAIDLLENTPIHCVTFIGLIEELREGWLKRAIRVKSQQSQVLN